MRRLISALILAPAAAFAGGYAIPNENTRSLALTQSDVAAQNGPEAAYQNASALAGQQGLAVTADLEMLYNRTDWSDPTLGSASMKPHANWPPAVAVGWGDKLPNQMPYGAGIAFLIPAGGVLFWPTGWAGAGRIQDVDLKVYLTQFSAGIQPLPWLKVGASLLWYRITESLSQQLNFIGSSGLASLALSANVLTYGVSGEFHVPTVPLTIGIDYRHQAPVTLSGNAHFDNVPPSFAPALQDQSATEAITVPNQLFLGAAYEVIPNLKVMGTWTLERWINYRNDTYVGGKGLVISVPRAYHNAEVYRFGGEWAHVPFLAPLTLRVGIERSISNQPGDTVSPTLTDGNSTSFAVGGGYDLIAGLRVDLAYRYTFFDSVSATDAQGKPCAPTSSPPCEALPGTYSTHVHFVGAGVTWRLPKF